jgi:hypothetical protein
MILRFSHLENMHLYSLEIIFHTIQNFPKVGDYLKSRILKNLNFFSIEGFEIW